MQRSEAIIPNSGIWYQAADIQFHIGTENEVNISKRHPAFKVLDLEEAREHLIRHGIILKEEIPIPGQIHFSFFDLLNNKIKLLQKI